MMMGGDDSDESLSDQECFDRAAFEARGEETEVVEDEVEEDVIHPTEAMLCGSCSPEFVSALQAYAGSGCYSDLMLFLVEEQHGDGDGEMSAAELEADPMLGLVALLYPMLVSERKRAIGTRSVH
jgi:hypothetical protein